MSTYQSRALIQRSTVPIRHRAGALSAHTVLARVADAAGSPAVAPTAAERVTGIGDSGERNRLS
jgi:hypothetical protein